MIHITRMKKIVAVALLLVFASSCEDVLDESPYSEISDEQFWLNNGNAESGIAAIYDAMQKTYRTKHYLWGEFRGDSYIASATPTGEALELLTNTLQPSSAGILRWNDLYQMIGRANLAIEKIPQIPSYSQSLLGEAYALRAYAYFDAVRVWGGVPLFTEAISGLDQELIRAKTDGTTILNDVVIPDMLKAEELITQPANKFRFSKTSVWAFQADVYMYLKQFDKAKQVLDKIVASGEYRLTNDRQSWNDMFYNDPDFGGKIMEGPELMMSIRFSLTEDNDRSGVFSLFFAGLPSYYIAPSLENKWIEKFPTDSALWVAKYPGFTPGGFEPDGTTLWGDWRYFDSREEGDPIGEARVAKYQSTNYSPSIDDTDIVLYRYAGILLLLAEAENQLGNKTAAVDLINQIRQARQLPTVNEDDFASVDELENFILDERQLELLSEGKRWWDLIRTDKAVEVMGPINGQTAETLLFPIFQDHLIDNPLLEQTPGYN
ncbi:RagB/SusD family nutrient uptake outer membrane protein [Namhaeicola litoreus]|uniref:RagB/SusD family nutrient uptake outer membrane protein n=2 Tax=Namhaeicola litoreus TaxID=1052145 RepID=A0ABW3Y3G3_9FLAO